MITDTDGLKRTQIQTDKSTINRHMLVCGLVVYHLFHAILPMWVSFALWAVVSMWQYLKRMQFENAKTELFLVRNALKFLQLD